MKKYQLNGIKRIYVVGECQTSFNDLLSNIKNRLIVKSEDLDKPHPKEIERMERRAAQEVGAENAEEPHDFMDRIMQQHRVIFGSDGVKVKAKQDGAFSNSLFILTGNYNIGTKSEKYYIDKLEKLNKILDYNGTYVFIIRGNNDNPEYFSKEIINFSNIKTIPDYSVISANDLNILCVGGGISVNRQWKIKQEERINNIKNSNKKLYWSDEAPVFDEDAIKEINNSVKINVIVSHSSPSFVGPQDDCLTNNWTNEDETLISDIKNERNVMNKIFASFNDITYWAFGHFRHNLLEKRSNIIFRSIISGFNPICIDDDIQSFYYAEKIKLKKKPKSGKKLFDDTFNMPTLNAINAIQINNDLEAGEEVGDRPGVGWIEEPIDIENDNALHTIERVGGMDGDNPVDNVAEENDDDDDVTIEAGDTMATATAIGGTNAAGVFTIDIGDIGAYRPQYNANNMHDINVANAIERLRRETATRLRRH